MLTIPWVMQGIVTDRLKNAAEWKDNVDASIQQATRWHSTSSMGPAANAIQASGMLKALHKYSANEVCASASQCITTSGAFVLSGMISGIAQLT